MSSENVKREKGNGIPAVVPPPIGGPDSRARKE